MTKDLSGRFALVPGGSGGIGSAVAEALLDAGADIAVSFRNNRERTERLKGYGESKGRKVSIRQVNAEDYSEVKRWVGETITEFGKIDILANCVGFDGTFSLFREQTPELWESMIGKQFWAGIYFAHCVVDHMIEQRWGRIISLGSDGAKVGQAGMAVGNAGGAGLIAFNKSLAREVARYGITVNAVCAGPTQTPALDRLRSTGDTGAKLVDAAIRTIPMKRPGDPRELGEAFVYLASDAAGFITGQAISVSGGLTMQ